MAGPIRPAISYDGYMELGEVARLFAVNADTIRRRLRAQGRSVYLYPSDKRLRMIKEEDIRAIFKIVPAQKRVRDGGVQEG